MDADTPVATLRRAVADFVRERDWERYHNPKDLAVSLCIEAAELLELFQWREPDSLPENARVAEELADVAIYCLSVANALDIDLSSAVENKLRRNAERYPASEWRGRARLG